MKRHLTSKSRTKQLLAFLLVIFFSVTAATAQKQYTVKLITPAAGQDIIKGQMYTVKFRINNTGTVAISMMDTIGVHIMVGMDMAYMGGTMYQLNPGDSVDMQINNFSYNNFTSDAAADFCLTVEVFGNVHPNPADKSSCETVNLKTVATGIAGQQAENPISLYPNPAKDAFTVKASRDAVGILGLYDLNGRKLSETTLTGLQTEVPTSQLADGIYLYRVSDKRAGLISSGRIVIQH
jgi:hypothetical protein